MNGIRRRLLTLLPEEETAKDRRKYNYADIVLWDLEHGYLIFINGYNYVQGSYYRDVTNSDGTTKREYYPVVGYSIAYRTPLNNYMRLVFALKPASCKTPLTGADSFEGIKFGAPYPDDTFKPFTALPVSSTDGVSFSTSPMKAQATTAYAPSDYFLNQKTRESVKGIVNSPDDELAAYSPQAKGAFIPSPLKGEGNAYRVDFLDNAKDGTTASIIDNAFMDLTEGQRLRHYFINQAIKGQNGWETGKNPIQNVSDPGYYPAYEASRAQPLDIPGFPNDHGLPTLGEMLILLSRRYSVTLALNKLYIKDYFGDYWWWTCTPYDKDNTWAVNFGTGEVAPKPNDTECGALTMSDSWADEHVEPAEACLHKDGKLYIVNGTFYQWTRNTILKGYDRVGIVGNITKDGEALVYGPYIDKTGKTYQTPNVALISFSNGNAVPSDATKYDGLQCFGTASGTDFTNTYVSTPEGDGNTANYAFPIQNASTVTLNNAWNRFKYLSGLTLRFNRKLNINTHYLLGTSKANNFLLMSSHEEYGFGDNASFYASTDSNGKTNALSEVSGKANTQKMVDAIKEDGKVPSDYSKTESYKYPAAFLAYHYKTAGTNEGDWYIPSLTELSYICERCAGITRSSSAHGFGYDFSSDGHPRIWSSTFNKDGRVYVMQPRANGGDVVMLSTPTPDYQTSFQGTLVPVTRISGWTDFTMIPDFLLYDAESQKKQILKGSLYNKTDYPEDRYTVIGMVVMTPKETGDNTYRAISIPIMDPARPEIGVVSDSLNIPFGVENTPNLESFNSVPNISNGQEIGGTIVSMKPSGKLASDSLISNGNNSIYSLDGLRQYYPRDFNNSIIPSQYNADGSMNPLFTQTTDASKFKNALSDRDGKKNTEETLKQAMVQTTWKTDEIIKIRYMKGYYPACCCAWRYHTPGTNQGDWYIPSAYEASFIAANSFKIAKGYFRLGFRKYEFSNNIWTSTYVDKNTNYALYNNGIEPVDNRQNLMALAMLSFTV